MRRLKTFFKIGGLPLQILHRFPKRVLYYGERFKKVAFEKRRVLASIQSFDRKYSQDFLKTGFMGNFRYTFSSVYAVNFVSSMKN